MDVYIVDGNAWKDIILIVSTQTKVELEHKVWLCLYQLKKET